MPAAFFDWEIKNTSDETTEYTLAFSVGNPFRISDDGFSAYAKKEGISCITLKSRTVARDSGDYGELAISTDCPDVSFQEYWYRGGWFDDVTTFWREFSAPGKLKSRRYDDSNRRGQLDIGDMCTLAARISLLPGETKTVRFIMAWYYPNFVKYWDKEKPMWHHEYARRFSSSDDVLRYCYNNAVILTEKSVLFRDALCSMTLPEAVIEAAADNLCVLKSPT